MTTGTVNIKRTIGTFVFFVVSVLLFMFLVRQIKISDIQRLAYQLTIAQLALLSGLYLLMAYFRGIRIGYAIREGNHARLTAIAAIHAFLNHILPFRLGELSLPLLIKAFTGRSLVAGSLSLVVIRLYDAVSIALMSLISLMVVGSQFNPSIREILWISAVAVVVVFIVVFGMLGPIVGLAARTASGGFRLMGQAGNRAAVKLDEAALRMRDEIDGLNSMQKYVFLPVSSLAVTVTNYALFYFTMVFMGIDIGFFKNMLASMGELITTFLPNTLGSFGTMEAGWAAGYMLCGVSKHDAIATGFIMHGIILVSGFVISGLGMVYLLLERRRNRDSSKG